MPIFVLAYLLSVGLDTGTTCTALAHGAREINPLMGQTCGSVVSGKTALTTATIAADRSVWPAHPTLAKTFLVIGIGINLGAAWHNNRIATR